MELSNYATWQKANSPQPYSLFDYVYGAGRSANIPADLFIAFAKLVWPDFVEIDGRIFLAEQYSKTKHEELLKNGSSTQEAQYWMNVFSVDGLFLEIAGDTPEHWEAFAAILRDSWEAKLRRDYPSRKFEVRVLRDENDDGADDILIVFTE